MLERLRWWIVLRLARRECRELERWRMKHQQYSQWLAEMPQIALMLQNMKCEVDGYGLDASYPPGPSGPWNIDGLRYKLRLMTHN